MPGASAGHLMSFNYPPAVIGGKGVIDLVYMHMWMVAVLEGEVLGNAFSIESLFCRWGTHEIYKVSVVEDLIMARSNLLGLSPPLPQPLHMRS